MMAADPVMTIEGTANKTLQLVLLTIGSAFAAVRFVRPEALGSGAMICLIAAFITGLVISFKPHTAPFLAPAYAILEGLALGFISLVYGQAYGNGIVFQATFGTMAVALTMAMLYRSGIIRVTGNFRRILSVAMGGILMFYLFMMATSFLAPGLYASVEYSPIMIGINLLIIGVAAASLCMDFDRIERFAGEVPAYMEWYGGFTILVTLIWLYMEILRLLSRLQRRR
jgi:uncharacterized YccA/Bax inhibitor family protein